MHSPKPLLGLLLLSGLVVLSYQEELNCYACMSNDKAECDNAAQKACPNGKNLCAKSYLVAGKGATTYAKDCVSQAECDEMNGERCKDVENGMRFCLECCTGDKCNGGKMPKKAEGMKCYSCRGDSEDKCLEDQEIKECKARGRWQCAAFTLQIGEKPLKYRKGCLGKKICKNTHGEVCKKIKSGAVMCYTCCDGELCNSGKIKAPTKKRTLFERLALKHE